MVQTSEESPELLREGNRVQTDIREAWLPFMATKSGEVSKIRESAPAEYMIPGTRTGMTVSFLSISFLFARVIRPTAKDPFSDRVDWKIRVEELMDRIHPRRLRLLDR